MPTNQTVTLREIAKMIDHSLLHPTMTDDDIRSGCELARRYDVATACVKPYSIPLARKVLAGSNVAVCPVIGFPHGNSTTANKVREAEEAAQAGGTDPLARLEAAVGVADLTNRTQQLNLQYAEAVVCFLFAGAVYLIVALGGGAIGGRLERKLAIKR